MEARISTTLLRRIMALAAADPEREVCGLLLGAALRVRPEPGRGTCLDDAPPAAGPADALGTNGAGADIKGILPAANVHPEPARRFELDPASLFAALRAARTGGPAVLGHYHSHPHGPAEPSPVDAAQAREPGQLWLIVAGDGARLWRVSRPGTFSAVPLRITDGGGCASSTESPQEPTAGGRTKGL